MNILLRFYLIFIRHILAAFTTERNIFNCDSQKKKKIVKLSSCPVKYRGVELSKSFYVHNLTEIDFQFG